MKVKDHKNRKEEYLEKIQNFCLMDDDFMTKCFEDNIEGVEFILRIIMKRPKLKIRKMHTQHVIKNLQGHSVQLDILAIDSYGKRYDIEVQRSDKGADVHRARYNGGIVDSSILPPGAEYTSLKDVYIIFITENDIFGAGAPIYHCNRINEETGKTLGDGSHILYVNGKYRNDDELGWLIHDFHCTDPKNMHYKILADRVRYFKEDEKGVGKMCKMLEEMFARMIEEEREELKKEVTETVTKEVAETITKEVTEAVTKEVTEAVTKEVTEAVTKEVTETVTKEVTKETARKTAKQLLELERLTIEEIARCVKLPIEEVQEIGVCI